MLITPIIKNIILINQSSQSNFSGDYAKRQQNNRAQIARVMHIFFEEMHQTFLRMITDLFIVFGVFYGKFLFKQRKEEVPLIPMAFFQSQVKRGTSFPDSQSSCCGRYSHSHTNAG